MHKLEWPCRILLLINCLLALSGYITFIQTEYQLVSPVIPSSTIVQIAKHAVYASLICGILFLIALCFYFYQKQMFAIIFSSMAITSYYIFSNYILL